MRVRISGERTGYTLDAEGHPVPVVVPGGSIGYAGPIGKGTRADTRNVIIEIDGRDVIVSDMRPGQYVELRE